MSENVERSGIDIEVFKLSTKKLITNQSNGQNRKMKGGSVRIRCEREIVRDAEKRSRPSQLSRRRCIEMKGRIIKGDVRYLLIRYNNVRRCFQHRHSQTVQTNNH